MKAGFEEQIRDREIADRQNEDSDDGFDDTETASESDANRRRDIRGVHRGYSEPEHVPKIRHLARR